MWHDELFGELESQKDKEQAEKMSAYMKNHFPFLGLPKPKLTAIIKTYIKKAAKEENINWGFVDACWQKEYREAQYAGVEYLIAVQNKLAEQDLEKLKELIVTKSWWDMSDSIDRIVGLLVRKYPALADVMLDWSKSGNIWLRRVAIDFQLQYKEKVDTGLLEKIICANFGTSRISPLKLLQRETGC